MILDALATTTTTAVGATGTALTVDTILAAKRAGIKEIILSNENKKNIDEIKDQYIKGLKFHFVDNAEDVLKIALTNQKVAKPVDIK